VNQQLFRDIERLDSSLGSLYLKDSDEEKYIVTGTIRYTPPESASDIFEVLIHIPHNYPYTVPTLYEIGGRYDFSNQRHINFDGSCCLEVPAILRREAQLGLRIARYIHRFVVPFFANQIFYDENGRFLSERSHGDVGIREHIQDLVRSTDPKVLTMILQYWRGSYKLGRNEKCFCQSGRRYKHCHLRPVQELSSYYSLEEVLSLHSAR
jgi:hypothetical protein